MAKDNKEYPVTVGFGQQLIGKLTLLPDTKIPMDCVFALGGKVTKRHKDAKGKQVIDEFELTEVSLITDENYKKHLSKHG